MLAHYYLQLYSSSSSFCFGQPLNQPHNQVATLLLSLPYGVCIYTVLIPDKTATTGRMDCFQYCTELRLV